MKPSSSNRKKVGLKKLMEIRAKKQKLIKNNKNPFLKSKLNQVSQKLMLTYTRNCIPSMPKSNWPNGNCLPPDQSRKNSSYPESSDLGRKKWIVKKIRAKKMGKLTLTGSSGNYMKPKKGISNKFPVIQIAKCHL